MHLQPFQFKLCCVCLCFCAGSSLPEEGMLQFLLACFVAASQAGLTGRPVWWRNQWWMEETETGWYVPCSRDGEWVFDDHMGWLSLDDWEDEFLPMPGAAIPQPAVLQPNKRHRPSMPTIPEEPGRSSSSASGLPGGGSGASGLPAEGRNANNMEQCLQMLGSYLERKKRFDNRGYRSQIRRQLRRLLDDNDIHYPDWLDDHTQPVNEWRDRAFKEIQSIKKTGKLTTQTGPSTGQTGPVPVSPAPVSGGASGLPAEGTGLSAIWQVQQQMTGLQRQLSAALAQLQTPPETPREKEKEKEQPTSPSSDMEVEAVDPRKTVSEPPRSPRPMVEEQSLQAGGNQDAGANGLPEEGIAGVQPEETAGVSSGTSLPAEGSAGVQSQQTAEMPSGANGLPEEGIAGGQSQQTAGMPSGANGLPAEGSFVLADPVLASVSSAGTGPPAGWHMVQEPFQDMSTIATQSVANMSEVDQNEVDFSEL